MKRLIRTLPKGHTTAPKCGMPVIEANVVFEWAKLELTGCTSHVERFLNHHLNMWQAERARRLLPSVPLSITVHLYTDNYAGRPIDPDPTMMITMIRAQLDPLLHANMSVDTIHTIFEDLVRVLCELLESRSGTIKCGPNITRLDFTQVEYEEDENLLGIEHGANP